VYANSNKELEDTVSKYGEIMSCMLKMRNDGKPLGYGYV
jgi:RNA recognition motif-containing protein